MRTRFTWIVGIAALISIGLLVACSTKYSSSNDGLVVLSTQGNAVMETFSLDLGNGHLSQINNVNGPPTPGIATSVILDPAGAYAYVATTVTCTPPSLAANTSLTSAVQGAILAYPIASDGKLAAAGAPTYLTGNPAYPSNFPTCGLDDATNPNAGNAPAAIVMDSAGKYLFVATAPGTATYTVNLNTTPMSTVATLNSVGIAVYAIGSGASLTQVAGSPFSLPAGPAGQLPTPSALAVTPTAFPPAYAVCSGNIPPTTEYLYVTDNLNYVVDAALVSAAGVLSWNVAQAPTGTLPSGVTVDPCNRFVYVSNSNTDNVSAYTICSVISYPECPDADYSLLPVSGSPFIAEHAPGPLLMDAYANFLYVLDTQSNAISAYRVSTTTGSLTPLSPATVATNAGGAGGYAASTSIAIRSDDSWMFVTNFNSATVSQYAITPATGALTPQPSSIATFNLPWGVAVK